MDARCLTRALVILLAAAAPALAQTPGTIVRESATADGTPALGNSAAPDVSADGRFVAFQSDASNLVPGDTNEDTDIFVRDRQTGVVQRVSVAWNGMEARDDSECPAISGDGRFVAFRSRAWNLYPGGANLGNPRWDVYVHDRQEGTTKRLSVAVDGGEPDFESGCPDISADGSRVVFHSYATNLVEDDNNEYFDVFVVEIATGEVRRVSTTPDDKDADGASFNPVISGDGRFVAFESWASNLRLPAPAQQAPLLPFTTAVFVTDLETGDCEAVSINAHDDYPYSPQGISFAPAISFDGRYVAFLSEAWNLVQPYPAHRAHVYLRDRIAGTTTRVSAEDAVGDCGRPGTDFPCKWAWHGSPAISDDGRFVAFATRASSLLPANLYHGDQVYLFDRVGGRLRRLSVEPNGWEGDGCSVEPALSGDGKILVYRSSSTNLAADDPNDGTDILAQEWTCDRRGRCRALAECPVEPADCAPAVRSLLRLRKRPPGGIHPDRLFWRWAGEAGSPTFPDPTSGDASYHLCVYGSGERRLALDVALPGAPECAGGKRPCWRSGTAAYKLLDSQGALTSVTLTRSSGTRRILVRGGGELLDAPYLPLDASSGIVVQLHEADSGRCWGASYEPAAIRRNDAGSAGQGSRKDGHLVAQAR